MKDTKVKLKKNVMDYLKTADEIVDVYFVTYVESCIRIIIHILHLGEIDI